MSIRRPSSLIGVIALLGVAGLSASTLAQSTPPAASPVLKGPEVKDRDVPGVVGEFGSTNVARRFADRMPPEIFRKALGVLTAEDAPADLRATDDQRAQFKELVEDFEVRVREYRRSHGKEIAELRKLAGEIQGPRDAKKAEKKADADDSMQNMSEGDQKKRDEAKAKLRELMEGAPKIDEVYTKVWAGLSEPQRKAVDAELEKFREEQAKQREEQYVKQRVKKSEAGGEAKKPAAESDDMMMKPSPVDQRPVERPLASRLSPERRDRLMRILSQMTPEEQDQLIQRLEARIKDRVGAPSPGEGDKPKGQKKNTKPAPNPDDVQVPEPDKK